jgi:hypothetical protein
VPVSQDNYINFDSLTEALAEFVFCSLAVARYPPKVLSILQTIDALFVASFFSRFDAT